MAFLTRKRPVPAELTGPHLAVNQTFADFLRDAGLVGVRIAPSASWPNIRLTRGILRLQTVATEELAELSDRAAVDAGRAAWYEMAPRTVETVLSVGKDLVREHPELAARAASLLADVHQDTAAVESLAERSRLRAARLRRQAESTEPSMKSALHLAVTRALLGEVEPTDVLPVLRRAYEAPRDPAVKTAALALAGGVPGDGPALHRRAYAAFVDDNYFEGFVVLLKSLLLTNAVRDADLVVLHDGLAPRNVLRARLLYPDIRFVRTDPAPYLSYVKGDSTNYLYVKAYLILDAFRRLRYDRVVTLDTDMVVLGEIEHLFDGVSAFAAVPQFYDSDGGRKLNSGLMAFDSTCMSDEFVGRIDAIGRSGQYELERHDQGVLTAVLDGKYEQLGRELNWVKRATKPDEPLAEDVKILHFTGRFKPWQGGELGYRLLEDRWHEYAVSDVAHMCRYVARTLDNAEAGTGTLSWYESLLADVPADQRRLLAQGHRPVDNPDGATVAVARLDAAQAGRFGAPLAEASRYLALGEPERAELLGRLALLEQVDGAEAFLADLR